MVGVGQVVGVLYGRRPCVFRCPCVAASLQSGDKTHFMFHRRLVLIQTFDILHIYISVSCRRLVER